MNLQACKFGSVDVKEAKFLAQISIQQGQSIKIHNFSLVAHYSLQISLSMILAVKSLIICCEIHLLLIEKFNCYSFQNSLVSKMTYYPVEKITHCKIHSLVASFEVTCGL